MKRVLLILLLTFSVIVESRSQEVTCEELMAYVIENGYLKGSVDPFALISSSWLKEVKAYTLENRIFVIAEIKRDDFGIRTKKYIFCGIPSFNWDAFYYGLYDMGKTYGERFHKYVYKYQCRCD